MQQLIFLNNSVTRFLPSIFVFKNHTEICFLLMKSRFHSEIRLPSSESIHDSTLHSRTPRWARKRCDRKSPRNRIQMRKYFTCWSTGLIAFYLYKKNKRHQDAINITLKNRFLESCMHFPVISNQKRSWNVKKWDFFQMKKFLFLLKKCLNLSQYLAKSIEILILLSSNWSTNFPNYFSVSFTSSVVLFARYL